MSWRRNDPGPPPRSYIRPHTPQPEILEDEDNPNDYDEVFDQVTGARYRRYHQQSTQAAPRHRSNRLHRVVSRGANRGVRNAPQNPEPSSPPYIGFIPPEPFPPIRPTFVPPPVLPNIAPARPPWVWPPEGTWQWTAHPQPHPNVAGPSPSRPNAPAGERRFLYDPTDPAFAYYLTGGWPLPGTAPDWVPGRWPPTEGPPRGTVRLAPWLIPNPRHRKRPHVIWNLKTPPNTASRVSSSGANKALIPKFQDMATQPPSTKIFVTCDVGYSASMWGPIVVEEENGRFLTVHDVLNAIYNYFQKPLTNEEVERIASFGPQNMQNLQTACYKRCRSRPDLPNWGQSGGFRRIDCLGDKTVFWGLWSTYNTDGTWQMNLGLTP